MTALLGLAIVPVALGVAGLLTTPKHGRGRVFAVLGIVFGAIETVLGIVLLIGLVLSATPRADLDPDGPRTQGTDEVYGYGDDSRLDALWDSRRARRGRTGVGVAVGVGVGAAGLANARPPRPVP